MRRIDLCLSSVKRIDASDDHAGGQKCAFDGVGSLARDDHVFDVARQGIKEICGCRTLGGHRQIHLAGEDLVGAN